MLIKCVECGSDVSDKAAACPRCGAPPSRVVTSAGAAAAVFPSPASRALTVEQTGKRWKSLQVVSIVAMCVGTVACVAKAEGASAVFWVAGLGGYVVSRVGAWWENG